MLQSAPGGIAITEQFDRRALYVLAFAVFSSFVAYTNVAPLLPLHILSLGVGSLHDAAFWTGLILGATPLTSAVASPFWGAVADRFGHKRIIQRSLFGFTGVYLLMALAPSTWHLLALRVAMGLFGGFVVQAMAMASTVAPRRQLTQAIGVIQLAQILGLAAGPLLGGLVGDRFGFAGAVLAAGALDCLAALAVTFLLPGTRPWPDKASEARLPVRSLFLLPGFASMLLGVGLIRLLDRSFDPLMPLLVIKLEPEIGSVAFFAGLIISLGTLATALSAALAGRLGDRFRDGWLLQGGLLVGAVLCLPFAAVTGIWQVLGLRVALGLATGGAMTLALAFAVQNVPAERRGAAFGILGAAGQYGNGLGMMGFGGLASVAFELPFLAAAGLYAITTAATGLAMRQRARKDLRFQV